MPKPLVVLYEECNGGPCPKVFEDADGQIVVQGSLVEDQDVLERTTPAGHERVVRIPRDVLLEAARALEAM
ncbi:MAG TPA: hypothetical protein VGG07_14305 [Solirubrobacteraceae bacterium]